jgi:hypothetical protein
MTPWFDIPYTLTPAQQASFETDGFLMLPDVLTPEQITDLQAWSAEVQT